MRPNTRFTAAIIAAALVTTGISQIAAAAFVPPGDKDLPAPVIDQAGTGIQDGEGDEAIDILTGSGPAPSFMKLARCTVSSIQDSVQAHQAVAAA